MRGSGASPGHTMKLSASWASGPVASARYGPMPPPRTRWDIRVVALTLSGWSFVRLKGRHPASRGVGALWPGALLAGFAGWLLTENRLRRRSPYIWQPCVLLGLRAVWLRRRRREIRTEPRRRGARHSSTNPPLSGVGRRLPGSLHSCRLAAGSVTVGARKPGRLEHEELDCHVGVVGDL